MIQNIKINLALEENCIAPQAPKGLEWLISDENSVSDEIFLNWDGTKLSLIGEEASFFIDIDQYLNRWKAQNLNPKKELIGRALGLKRSEEMVILDASAGAGQDLSLFLFWNFKVVSFERNPLVYALLCDARARMRDEKRKELWSPYLGEAVEYDDFEGIDCIYFDPMFSEKGKKSSSKAKKGMELFKGLVGRDQDDQQTASRLLELGHLLVVKRAPKSPLLIESPNAQWKGKAVRFDRYFRPQA